MVDVTESLTLGVVLRRRLSDHPWADTVLSVDAVIPDGIAAPAGTLLHHHDGDAHLYGGSLTLSLFRKDTEGYRRNLSSPPGAVYVLLRGPADGAPAVEGLDLVPVLVTVCPYEAESYQNAGDEHVDAVAMPAPIRTAVEAFVARHHVDEPFVKRKRKGGNAMGRVS